MLNISNIQHFSVGDGDGIRTTVFLKGCNLRCPWCHNPETIPFEAVKLNYPKLDKTEICGKKMTAEEVFKEILEDKAFYEESGGGVTLSGGETMLQANAVAELLKLIKEEEISVFIDTAGCVPYSEFEKINTYVDTYLFDFKTASEEKYAEIIKGDLSLVKENIRKLIKAHKNIRIRIPLIPDFNIDAQSIEYMCDALIELGVKKVDLLPFHRMGSGKYEALSKEYKYKNTQLIDKKTLERIKNKFSEYFETTIEN
ncbi:MAG: glycyl-radical enzyme activating protein [Clostridia bacterium]|nr:glycyl-radical enzyme activating protein [Clostridia bacterium]